MTDNAQTISSTPSPAQSCCCKPAGSPGRLTSAITPADRWGGFMCRISDRFRMRYHIPAGLYALGSPEKTSPVMVSANYRLSLNHLRGALKGRDAWILVLDTKGINVWCAAGKGAFGTQEIIRRLSATGLASRVSHRTLILPQLGAPGVAAHSVQRESGFAVRYGPVRAKDLPAYLDNGANATTAMRCVGFSFTDRLKLAPMEAIPALKQLALFLLVGAALFGITGAGILYRQALQGILPLALAGIVAVVAGSVITPLLLPLVPGRAFSVKGFLAGAAAAAATIAISPSINRNLLFAAFCAVAIPLYSSYRAFLFTGSSAFTNPSGVKAELRIAWPAYLAGAGLCAAGFICILIRHWGLW